jgi:multicomponent Na+:H+ antiporter subunit G
MSATTKSATLGVSFMLLAAAAYFGDPGILERAVATVAFLFVTAPVAAHMIARAAYIRELALWEGTVVDELEGQYDLHHNRLAGAHTTHNRDAQPAPEADPWP